MKADCDKCKKMVEVTGEYCGHFYGVCGHMLGFSAFLAGIRLPNPGTINRWNNDGTKIVPVKVE